MRTAVLAVLLVACGDDGAHHDAPPIDTAIDGTADTAIDGTGTPAECAQCTADQTCVVYFGGTCQVMAVSCVDRPADCDGVTCSAACMDAFCTAPYQCEDPCPSLPAHTFGCYGP